MMYETPLEEHNQEFLLTQMEYPEAAIAHFTNGATVLLSGNDEGRDIRVRGALQWARAFARAKYAIDLENFVMAMHDHKGMLTVVLSAIPHGISSHDVAACFRSAWDELNEDGLYELFLGAEPLLQHAHFRNRNEGAHDVALAERLILIYNAFQRTSK